MQSSNKLLYKKFDITGRVQGVFYRQSTLQQAIKLGLVGWVQNQANGNVLVWVKGETSQVSQLVDWLKKGPPRSHVLLVTELALTQAEIEHLDRLIDFTIAR